MRWVFDLRPLRCATAMGTRTAEGIHLAREVVATRRGLSGRGTIHTGDAATRGKARSSLAGFGARIALEPSAAPVVHCEGHLAAGFPLRHATQPEMLVTGRAVAASISARRTRADPGHRALACAAVLRRAYARVTVGDRSVDGYRGVDLGRVSVPFDRRVQAGIRSSVGPGVAGPTPQRRSRQHEKRQSQAHRVRAHVPMVVAIEDTIHDRALRSLDPARAR